MAALSWDRGTQTMQPTKSIIFFCGPLEKKVVDLFMFYIPGNLDFWIWKKWENWLSKDLCWIYDNVQEKPFLVIITNGDSGA